jgi:ParB family chromosome partitioning protein
VSSARRVGLPETLRMRHDSHFVDRLAHPGGRPVGRLIPIEEIDPNPNQPRQTIGDLSELVASIREKGVLEPILVRQREGRFQIIAGERRYRAAVEVGLDEVPCIERECDDAEVVEIALIENLQRKDLSPFEEADGLRTLADKYGYTHETMAEHLGKSRSSITETLSLATMPESVRKLCRLADIDSKSLLLQVVRQSSPEKMVALLQQLQEQGATTRRQARQVVKGARGRAGRGRPRHYVFRYAPGDKTYAVAVRFKKSQVPREEIVRALQSIIEDLMREES